MQIRKVITSSGSIAVQVIRYENRRRIVVKHIGSGKNDEAVSHLVREAHRWISAHSGQLDIFNSRPIVNDIEDYDLIGIQYSFFYETIMGLQQQIGYEAIGTQLVQNLVTMRLFEPSSKLRAIKLLESCFGIKSLRKYYYQEVKRLNLLRERAGEITIAFARRMFGNDFTLLFYDVTTLYFETFEEDDLRKTGFSKDNKPQQPQVLIGLMVNKEGFPLCYEVFSGNTFEGHTMLPVIKNFKAKLGIENITVIADAAMISAANIAALREEKINYIVGARLGNISSKMLQRIDTALERTDGSHMRITSEAGDDYLICGYAAKRFAKDRHEMDKQIARARKMVEQPGLSKRTKFLIAEGQKLTINERLIAKTTKLLGIKGYYTNLNEAEAGNEIIMERYHDLYKIEQAFRISKHDLKTRPIYHYRQEPIKMHILICFMALAISKLIEIKTSLSIQSFVEAVKSITDATLRHNKTGKEVKKRKALTQEIIEILQKLNLPH